MVLVVGCRQLSLRRVQTLLIRGARRRDTSDANLNVRPGFFCELAEEIVEVHLGCVVNRSNTFRQNEQLNPLTR